MRRRREAVADAVREGGGLLPALPLWGWWLTDEAGFDRLTWLPATGVLALVVVLLHRRVARPPLRDARAWAFGALLGLTAWSAVSIIWAQDRGAAWTGAQRAGLVCVATGLVLLWPPSRRMLRGGLVAYAGAVVLAGIVALARAADDPTVLVDGRLVGPAGYVNASAALFVMTSLALLALGAGVRAAPDRSARSRAVTMLAGGTALGGSGLLAALGLLTQSRYGAAVAAGGLAVAAAVAPARGRIMLAAGAVSAAVFLLRDPLLDLRVDALRGTGDAAAAGALGALALITLVTAIAGALIALLPEHRVRVAGRPGTVRRRVVVAAALLVLTSGAVTAADIQGRPGSWAAARVSDFKTPDYAHLEARSSRFGGGLGSNRYDYWRVAVKAGGTRPLTGVGVEGFGPVYLRDRRSTKAPRYAHNLWLGTFAELGLPGLGLLLAAALALAAGWLAALRRTTATDRPPLVAAALPAVVLALHASADWSAAFCALTIPALALLAAAGAPGAGMEAPARSGPAGRLLLVAAAALALTALPLLGAARLEDRALAHAAADPGRALADLRLAGRLDRIGPRPPLLEAVVLLDAGDRRGATGAFAQAVDRDDGAWYPRFILGVLLAPTDRAAALRELATARRLNPRERLVGSTYAAVRLGAVPDAHALSHRALSLPG